MYKLSKTLTDTRGGLDDTKWIIVLSTLMLLYIVTKVKGRLQHSSFLHGGATISSMKEVRT